jgi:hypothetical protein
MTDKTPATKTVPVKSAWSSKINWIVGIGSALTAASALCATPQVVAAVALIPAPYGAYVTAGMAAITGVATWYVRTYKTLSVLAPSLSK